ncbi:MAG: hypothetical protein K6F30_01765 [Lachnospiraceae bacterium]|nr:hypothetical protein [Lachnospiraceae bacterium]
MRKYVGITIGPITNALQYAKDPQSLWFACAIFSEISRELCELITAPNCSFEEVVIYTPYYFHGMKIDDGVAKTHDRIIFSAEHVENHVIDKMIELVKEDVCDLFPVEYQSQEYRQFLKDYFQIKYICLEENNELNHNCMMTIYPYLHDMESMQKGNTETFLNPFYDLFGLGEDTRSFRIMTSPIAHLVKKGSAQFFNLRGEFKTVAEIANPKLPEGRKKAPYYCLVRCNGDNIDMLLRGFSDNKKIISFSVACLQHSITTSELIRMFGGLTVYAGGDECFFFAPLVGMDGSTIFELCQRIQQKFYTFMKNHLPWSNIPTLSFGVSIQRNTHDAYDVFVETGKLLDVAKQISDKNNTAVRITNKSRSECIVVNNQDIDAFLDIFKANLDIMDGMITTERKKNQLSETIALIDEYENIIMSISEMAKNGNLSPEEYFKSVSSIFQGGTLERSPEELKNLLILYYKRLVRKPRGIWVPKIDEVTGKYLKANHYNAEDGSIGVFEEILNMKEDILELKEEYTP